MTFSFQHFTFTDASLPGQGSVISTYADNMKALLLAVSVVLCASNVRGDSVAEYYKDFPSLDRKFDVLAPTLDKLMIRCSKDERFPYLTQWTLARQVTTSLYLTHGPGGDIVGASMQFYLGYDKEREKNLQRCLPIARWLIGTMMNDTDLTVDEIEQALRSIESSDRIKEYRESDRVMYFRYKFSQPESKDGYRCFRIEIGNADSKPSTDT